MTVHIRRATPRDIKGILPVWGQLAEYHSGLDAAFTPSEHWSREYAAYLRTLMSRDDAIAVVASNDEEIVGYAVGRITTLPAFFATRYRGYIHDVYVMEPYRRRGVGRRLVAEILTWLRQHGVSMVELTVAARNEAIPFWESLGFRTYMHQMKLKLRD